MTAPLSYKEWHIPFSNDQITLRHAKKSLTHPLAPKKISPQELRLELPLQAVSVSSEAPW